ncbi:hypothetical protein GCM10009624_11210 [Gordonia sinesedis]
MASWLLRGAVMSVVMIVARVLLGIVVVEAPLHTTVWKTVAIAVVVLIALIWGGIDGVRDARANPDPDDYEDLTVRWLKAGLFAGVTSGFVCWLIGTLWLPGIGQAGFFIELIAGASFTALLIFIPAFVGTAAGRFLMRRDQRKQQRQHDWSVHDERPAEQVAH